MQQVVVNLDDRLSNQLSRYGAKYSIGVAETMKMLARFYLGGDCAFDPARCDSCSKVNECYPDGFGYVQKKAGDFECAF